MVDGSIYSVSCDCYVQKVTAQEDYHCRANTEDMVNLKMCMR